VSKLKKRSAQVKAAARDEARSTVSDFRELVDQTLTATRKTSPLDQEMAMMLRPVYMKFNDARFDTRGE